MPAYTTFNGARYSLQPDGSWRWAPEQTNAGTMRYGAASHPTILAGTQQAEALQQSITGGGGNAENIMLGLQGAAGVNQLQNNLDTEQLTQMEQQYNEIPETLNNLYSNAAKRGGTYANTNEFNVGLQSEVKQGTRGAQAALGSRMAAVMQRLGRPLPPHLQQYASGGTDSNNVDNAAVEPTNNVGDADNTSSYQQQTRDGEISAADTQNAVTKVADPTKAKLAAVKAAATEETK